MLQAFDQLAPIGQLARFAAGVRDDYLIVVFIGLGFAQKRSKGRKPRARRKEPKPLAGQQSVMHQSAHRLGAHNHLIAHLDMLQARRERAVLDLDRIEFQLFIPRGRCNRIGAKQRLGLARLFIHIAHQTNHHKLARAKPHRRRTRHSKRKQAVRPMLDFGHCLRIGQGGFLRGCV